MAIKVFEFLLLLSLLLLLFLDSTNAQGLQFGFYNKTCPSVEAIVRQEMSSVIAVAPSLSGPLLRMQFHDCFVRGCEASVLLNTTNATQPAEKASFPDQTLRGYQIIDRVKAKLEAACPGIVSCADVIALVARDAVVLTNGPHWNVLTGRRDGLVSNATEANLGLPPPTSNITQLINAFTQLGLSIKDLVVLSGSHTIGISHCSSFSNRIYNFTGKGTPNDTDPTLDVNYVPFLRSKCKPNDATTFVEMDPGSFKTFDMGYYKLVAKRRGLLQTDAAVLQNSQTRAYVLRQATAATTEFFNDFGVSMVKMANIGVLTGSQGEIRKHCAVIN